MRAIRLEHIPRWILLIGLIGTPVAAILSGPLSGAGFAVGVIASWWNYRYLQNLVAELAQAAANQASPGSGRLVAGFFGRFLLLALGSIVILKYSKVSVIALLAGLFAACFAICLEILYELLWSKSTKSG